MRTLVALLLALTTPPLLAAQSSQVVIPLTGNVPAQCTSQPFRVLVENGVITVTQYLRCNHPGRYVIRLADSTKSQWAGTSAKYKQALKSLEAGSTDFEITAGAGGVETFTITPKNPAAARDLAKNLNTYVSVQ